MGCCGTGRLGSNIPSGSRLFGAGLAHPSWINRREQDPLPSWAKRNQNGWIKVKIGAVAALDLVASDLVVSQSILEYLKSNSPELFTTYPYSDPAVETAIDPKPKNP